MKKAINFLVGTAAVVAVSAGVAGVTSYALMQPEQNNTLAFDEVFQPNTNMRLAALDAAHLQPVDLTQAAENSVNAVVHIKSTQESKTQTVTVRDPFYEFFGDMFGNRGGQQRQVQTPEKVGFGSGVIISKDGYIVTNNHVIDHADIISVKLNDGREFKGRIIGTDPSTDLALVKIEGDDLPTIPVGDSDQLKIGEWVLAVGNPFNMTSTVTAGIVSAKARSLGVYNNGVESFIQTDAAINQGNSGGALVNARGELVGINSVLYSPTGSYSGYGFAIPTSIMTKVVSDLKQFGAVQRAMLGIKGTPIDDDGQLMDEKTKQQVKDLGATEGVWVREVVEGGSAAGILEENDVIIGIDGKRVKNFAGLQEALAKHRPGDKVSVKVIRDKKEKNLEMLLKNEQGNTKVLKNTGMEILGAAFREVPQELKRQLNLGTGIEVTGVSDGKMQEAGVRKGFIILKANGQSIKTVEQLEEVVKAAARSTDQVLFLSGIFPSGKRANYAVDLSQE
ncbi:MAG: trypsin-like peptidase domain-containing protein [Bacteroidaceae bacterium]|jgi:Do/DeqQ family serine protease|nr:trypsin-like peptidase domain-containing protein [Bacteroidaceae bacterium]